MDVPTAIQDCLIQLCFYRLAGGPLETLAPKRSLSPYIKTREGAHV